MPLIEVDELSFAYGAGAAVLNGLTANINGGEICGLVGASGCGKSTLLKLVAGVLPWDGRQRLEGCVTVLGDTPVHSRQAGKIGYVFQEYRLLPFKTVEENMLWAAQHRPSADVRNSEKSIGELLELVGLEKYRRVYPGELSGGMQARAAIARAIIGRPPLVLIDEAFSALDIGWRLSLYEELRRLRDALDLTLVLISHDIEEMCGMADHIVALTSHGSLAGEFRIDDHSEKATVNLVNKLRELLLVDHPALLGNVK